jgi:CubicO group peptidase (beta-lactamase class C family)
MRFLIIAAFAVVSARANAQGLTGPAIDSLVLRTMHAFNVPGIAVSVIKDGKVIHSRGYGVRSLRTGLPVDENTLFGIASNSKAFTTAALGILVDQGKLSWDDRVRDYIPEFRLSDPYVSDAFTIRDLLTHRSGLGLGAGDLMIWPDPNNFSKEDIIRNLHFLQPTSGFRARYAYDNNMYIVAGEVIARISGQSWEDFVEDHIFKPLGMRLSAPSFERIPDTTDIIDAHALVDGTLRIVPRSTMPIGHSAGGIYSNLTDLNRWVLMHLNGGTPLLSASVHKEIWSPQTIMPVGAPGTYNTHFQAYGLGFVLSDVKGFEQVRHNGGLAGMVTQITMIPELRLGIVVLTNQEQDLALETISNQIKDAYLGVRGIDRVALYTAALKMELTQADKITDSVWAQIDTASRRPPAPSFLSPFTGVYQDPWFGNTTISIKDGQLYFTAQRSPHLCGRLFFYKANTFVVKWDDRSMNADAFLLFTLDQDGKAAGLTMKAISPLTDFSFDFQDLSFQRVP